MRNVGMFFLIALVFAGFGFYQYTQGKSESDELATLSADFKPKAGYEAASFELPDLDEKSYSSRSGQGKLMLVNFWASWCGPCELEAPDLQKLHENYGDQMILLGVNSTNYDKERSARQFAHDQGFTFPILMDREGNVTKTYKVNTFPTSFLIDSEGIIRERINGVITYAEWERIILKWS